MKKKSLIPLLIPTLLFGAVSCHPTVDTSKIILDFGRVVSEQGTTVNEVTYKTLKDMMIEKGESFILVISDQGCGCWTDFQPKVARVNYKYQLNIMHVRNDQSGFLENDFGLNTSTTGIAFFRDGKLVRQVVYKSDSSNYDIFRKANDDSALEKLINDNVEMPHVRYISKDILDSYISQNKEFNLYIGRNKCGDCDNINATLLKQWNRTATVQDSLYYFDIEEYRGTSEYQTIKDDYGLSQKYNAVLGYDYVDVFNGNEYKTEGAVPTFQHRKGSTIEDMIVLLNDAVDTNIRTFTHTYFTSTRVAVMPFLAETGDQYVLEGKELTQDEADNWRKSEQLKYHTPIFNLFFDTYFN